MELKAEVKISEDLLRLGERAKDGIEAGLIRAAGAVEAEAVRETPVVSGNLADSIRKYVDMVRLRATIGPQAKYAVFVNQGTGIYGPHKTPIVPTTKKALAWVSPMRIGNRWISGFMVRRSVKGQKANPFMARALKKIEPRLGEIFMAGFNSIVK